jgi:mannose-6-phosphate isomerase class I
VNLVLAEPNLIIKGSKVDLSTIQDHRTNKQVLHMKNFISDLPKWDNFFSHLNEMIKRVDEGFGNPGVMDRGGYIKGGVNFWETLTMTVEYPTERHFTFLNQYIDKLKSIHPHDYRGCFTVISLTNAEKTTSKHTDPVDVFYMQTIGKVVWEITKDDGTVNRYLLEPGDVIFVPAFTWHEIISLEPRAALSFMFFRDETNTL